MAGGCWVFAHECGHGAFHPNRRVEASVGFVLPSLLLVPYFTWQHSHGVHHANCNHLDGGETHVPPQASLPCGQRVLALSHRLGPKLYDVHPGSQPGGWGQVRRSKPIRSKGSDQSFIRSARQLEVSRSAGQSVRSGAAG